MMRTTVVLLLTGLYALAQSPQLTWQGEVDRVTNLIVQRDRVNVEDRHGAATRAADYRFATPLPEAPQVVEVRKREGRGRVSIVQQPRPENRYTLTVRIEDQTAGFSRYALDFFWRADPNAPYPYTRGTAPVKEKAEADTDPTNGRYTYGGFNRATWSGRVEDDLIIEFRQDRAITRLSGGQQSNTGTTHFTGPLPNAPVQVTLQNVRGGQVQLIEQPRPENNFAAVVRVARPAQKGAECSFALIWNDNATAPSGSGERPR